MVPATNSLQSHLWETSDFCKCTWLSPKSSRFAGRKSFQQSCSGKGLSLIPINHGGNLPHICQSRFLSQSLPPALEDSRAAGRMAAGIAKTRVPPLWLGFFPRGQAGAAAGISLCCFWHLPPDGQDLWCLGEVELSDSSAQSWAWIPLCCCRLHQQNQAPSTTYSSLILCSFCGFAGQPKSL